MPARAVCGLIVAGLIVGLVPTLRGEGVRKASQVEIVGPAADKTQKASAPAAVEPEKPADKAAMRAEVRRAVKYLTGLQQSDGSFVQKDGQNVYVTGQSGLGLLALKQAGLPNADPHVASAAAFLRKQEPTMTYEIALQTVALCSIGAKEDARLIQRNVTLLEEVQLEGGPGRGAWSYSSKLRRLGGGDNSNSEFAVWALDEAARYGTKVAPETWRRTAQYWKEHQNFDGGWSYSGAAAPRGSTGSMTCSGVASMSICLARLKTAGIDADEDDKAVVEKGLTWLGTNFAAAENPGDQRWLLYYAMVVRRAGDLTGREKFGDHDWRGEMTASLLRRQDAASGSWNEGSAAHVGDVVHTSMALIAIAGKPAAAGK